MEVKRTQRGFELIEFLDRNSQPCSLQQSSAADYETPGSSAVWLGLGDHRMHLSLDHVSELVIYLQRWLDDGSFQIVDEPDGTVSEELPK
jgi:hypothetical protein